MVTVEAKNTGSGGCDTEEGDQGSGGAKWCGGSEREL